MDRKELAAKISAKRTIPFFGTLDKDLYLLVRNALLNLAAASNKPITILFDSAGGGTFYSFQLGDLIRLIPCDVIGVVLEANSAACTLLQYCTKRLIVPSGRILIHNGQPTDAGFNGCKYTSDENWELQMRNWANELKAGNANIRKLFCERSGLPESRWEELMKRGDELRYSLTANEALELKLVDEIIPPDFKLYIPQVKNKETEEAENKEGKK
jgi:ATP-dependent protease ClpP protease subunit